MIKYILTLFLFLAECTAIDNSEDCCSSINLCGHNQGNCKTDEDCQGDFTCEDTCPDGFPDGYKCCKNLCKFILNTLKYSIYNGAKLGGATGAMVPLVFWSQSLKMS